MVFMTIDFLAWFRNKVYDFSTAVFQKWFKTGADVVVVVVFLISGNLLHLAVTAIVGQYSRVTLHC